MLNLSFVILPIGLCGPGAVMAPCGMDGSTTCYLTVIGAKCGTDIVVSPVQCGSQVCNTEQWVYDFVKSCTTNQIGYSECVSTNCVKYVFERECVLLPSGQWACNPIGSMPEQEPQIPDQMASGASCNTGPPG